MVHNLKVSFSQVRKKASEYLLSHPDDFLPFLPSETDELLTEEKYTEYCSDVANTATWGGQIEISALSKAYAVPITVLQKDTTLKIGLEEFPSSEPLKISYHRHAYGLGCHYNSLRPKAPVDEFKDLEV
ncbi:OTU protein [Entomophthora muscae]|uniref:OTU protein n=1 Tax=Entomophthora muscae TaxID=34485 RepID=A0ACC2UBY5_9FUNG|nr:OTU protein [Entomophthora muscae]